MHLLPFSPAPRGPPSPARAELSPAGLLRAWPPACPRAGADITLCAASSGRPRPRRRGSPTGRGGRGSGRPSRPVSVPAAARAGKKPSPGRRSALRQRSPSGRLRGPRPRVPAAPPGPPRPAHAQARGREAGQFLSGGSAPSAPPLGCSSQRHCPKGSGARGREQIAPRVRRQGCSAQVSLARSLTRGKSGARRGSDPGGGPWSGCEGLVGRGAPQTSAAQSMAALPRCQRFCRLGSAVVLSGGRAAHHMGSLFKLQRTRKTC